MCLFYNLFLITEKERILKMKELQPNYTEINSDDIRKAMHLIFLDCNFGNMDQNLQQDYIEPEYKISYFNPVEYVKFANVQFHLADTDQDIVLTIPAKFNLEVKSALEKNIYFAKSEQEKIEAVAALLTKVFYLTLHRWINNRISYLNQNQFDMLTETYAQLRDVFSFYNDNSVSELNSVAN